MLEITRNTRESIIIDDNIEVVVLEIRGSQVHLGIAAPRTTSIARKELLDPETLPPTVKREFTQRINESLVLDDLVEVSLLEVRGSQARLGIKAPRSVKVDRKEVLGKYDRKTDDSE